MTVPPDLQVLFRGKATMLREIAATLAAGGIRAVTGAIPSR
ncbi:MAG: hypothetical protein ACK5AL_14985 [Planctomycetota bacterium]